MRLTEVILLLIILLLLLKVFSMAYTLGPSLADRITTNLETFKSEH